MAQLDVDGRDALHYAARDGDVERIESRLDAGVDVNLVDKHQYIPLHFAADNGRVDSATDGRERTPADVAAGQFEFPDELNQMLAA